LVPWSSAYAEETGLRPVNPDGEAGDITHADPLIELPTREKGHDRQHFRSGGQFSLPFIQAALRLEAGGDESNR
jgi:hypothetical protein